jgi:hypothetical protein
MVVFARGVNVAVPWTRAMPRPSIAWSSYQLADGTAVLVVSDGEENESRIRLSQIVTTRRQSEVLVYAFSTDVAVVRPPTTRADAQLGPERSNGLPPPSTIRLHVAAADQRPAGARWRFGRGGISDHCAGDRGDGGTHGDRRAALAVHARLHTGEGGRRPVSPGQGRAAQPRVARPPPGGLSINRRSSRDGGRSSNGVAPRSRITRQRTRRSPCARRRDRSTQSPRQRCRARPRSAHTSSSHLARRLW